MLIKRKISLIKSVKMLSHAAYVYIKSIILFQQYLNHTVTIYGSARISTNTPEYEATKQLAKQLSDFGYAIMTGGGPGLMQAANEGAKLGKSASLGCTINIEHEKKRNKFLDKQVHCKYFFIRKMILTNFSSAFIVAPGGYGTLDELFEVLNLIITHKSPQYPVILFGKDYWTPLVTFLATKAVPLNTIDNEALKLIHIADSFQEICEIIQAC